MIKLRSHGIPFGLTDLPSELVLHICHLVPSNDLPSLSRTSRTLYDTAVPLIYRHITLTNSQSAYLCLGTLADSPKDHDLARHVLTFAMEPFLPWNFGQRQMLYFRRCLLKSIARMVYMHSFRCMLAGSFADDMAGALSARSTTLTSLSVSLPVVSPWLEAQLPSWQHEILHLRLPHLDAFEFDYASDRTPICPMYERFVQHMVRSHSSHLKFLKFPPWFTADYFLTVVPRSISLPALQSITIQSSALNIQVAAKLYTVTSLTFPSYEPRVHPAIPSISFPLLESFSGSCRVFGDILATPTPRPIRVVQFDGAVFDMEDTSIFAENNQPTWSDVFSAFQRFPASTGPVRELSFYVRSLHIPSLRKAAPFWSSLESVTICLRGDPKDVQKLPTLGKYLLSSMPVLHTFLLSDEPAFVYRNKRFSFALNEPLQRSILVKWAKACPTLRTVSFTAAFVWEREEAGKRWTKGVGPRRAGGVGSVMRHVKP